MALGKEGIQRNVCPFGVQHCEGVLPIVSVYLFGHNVGASLLAVSQSILECKFQSLKFHDFCQKILGVGGRSHDQHYVKNKFKK